MRSNVSVAAEPRTGRGKNENRRLRAAGKLPAVVYGAGKDAAAIAVDPRAITKILQSPAGHNTLFPLAIEGAGPSLAMIVDWQLHPVKSTLLHADIQWIDLQKRIRVKVPVLTHGAAYGVKTEGGQLELVTREVQVECLPDEIPEHFDLDVTALRMGQSIRAGQLPLEGSVKLVDSAEEVVVHIVAIRGAEAVATEAVVAAAPVAEAAKKAEPAKKDTKKK